MSTTPSPDEHVTSLAPAYALSALRADERAYVEQHLLSCAECAETVALCQHFAAFLAYVTTPYRAPSDLRGRLLQDVAAPLAPELDQGASAAEPTALDSTQEPEEGVAIMVQPRSTPRRWRLRRAALVRLVTWTIPWVLAVLGWLVAFAFIVYSHGQSDRLATTHQADQTQIAQLIAERNAASTVEDFLLTPGVRVSPLIYQAGTAPDTNVTLFSAPGYIHGVIAARGLARLPKQKIYVIWAVNVAGGIIRMGTLTTSGPRAQGASTIVAPHALDNYARIGISIEPVPPPRQPTAALIFLLKQRPLVIPGQS